MSSIDCLEPTRLFTPQVLECLNLDLVLLSSRTTNFSYKVYRGFLNFGI